MGAWGQRLKRASRRLVRGRRAAPVVLTVGAMGVATFGVAAAARLNVEDVIPARPASVETSPNRTLRAFDARSWWNTPLPDDAPSDPHAAEILSYLSTGPESGGGCLKLAGLKDSVWGMPIYWSQPTDPVYRVGETGHRLPPELESLRIPVNARPARNSDRTMVIYDVQAGYVVAMTDARYKKATNTWTAKGATVTYLHSNGLHVKTGKSDTRRNRGTHRGNNPATMAVSWDQVQTGAVRHVFKIAAGPTVSHRHVFPLVGSDGQYRGTDPQVPPEGLRLRIKPSVDLDKMNLAPEALVIARALQEYGAYIGDSGGRTALKVEDTVGEGRGHLWSLDRDALCRLRFQPKYWDVVAESYDPSRGARATR